MGPMWMNTQYTSVVPTGGTGLQGSKPAISKVTFCADEYDAKKSLAPMAGAGVVYSAEWYNKDGKLLEHLTTRKPNDDEPVKGPKSEDGTPPPPSPHGPDDDDTKPRNESNDNAKSDNENDNAQSNNDNADAESKQVSDSDSGSSSGSGSGSSGSSSGSEDSSKDSSSGSSNKSDGRSQSEGHSDAPKRKVRRKKKVHQSSSGESEEESNAEAGRTQVNDSNKEETEKDSRDFGVGDSTSIIPAMASSGEAAVLGLKGMASATIKGALSLLATLPSMATLRLLTNDLEKYSEEMFDDLEKTNIAIYERVLDGFKDTGGKCKSFIHEMGALAIAFFAQAKEMEGGLAKCDAENFAEVMDALKDHVFHLIQEVADAKGIYNKGEAHFDKILASTAKEVKQYIVPKGAAQ